MKRIFLICSVVFLTGCGVVDSLTEEGGYFDAHYAGCVEVFNSTEEGMTVRAKTGQEDNFVNVPYLGYSRHTIDRDRLSDEYGRYIADARVNVYVNLIDSENRTVRADPVSVKASRFDRNSGCAMVDVSVYRHYNGLLGVKVTPY